MHTPCLLPSQPASLPARAYTATGCRRRAGAAAIAPSKCCWAASSCWLASFSGLRVKVRAQRLTSLMGPNQRSRQPRADRPSCAWCASADGDALARAEHDDERLWAGWMDGGLSACCCRHAHTHPSSHSPAHARMHNLPPPRATTGRLGNYTFIGNDTGSLAVERAGLKSTVGECAAWCTATAGCMVFQYGSRAAAGHAAPHVCAGAAGDCCALLYGYPAAGDAFFAGVSAYAAYDLVASAVDIKGFDVEAGTAKAGVTLDVCRALCASNPKCKMVVYGDDAGGTLGWCYQKTGVPAITNLIVGSTFSAFLAGAWGRTQQRAGGWGGVRGHIVVRSRGHAGACSDCKIGGLAWRLA